MDIEIIAVGGYDEVGRNMTAVRCGKEIVIFDMGLRLDQVMIHEDAEMSRICTPWILIKIGAIPDDTMMNSVEGTVKAIVCSHGHLDHIGAIPKLAPVQRTDHCRSLRNGTDPAADLGRTEIRGQQQALSRSGPGSGTRSRSISCSSLSGPSIRSSIP